MKTEFNFKEYKVGSAVYHVTRGWTKIESIEKDYFEVVNDGCPFFLDGRINTTDSYPTIYPYNPFEENEEREVEVMLIDIETGKVKWEKRTSIYFNNNVAVCLNDKGDPFIFYEWREIQPQRELSQEEKINILWKKHETELMILKLKK